MQVSVESTGTLERRMTITVPEEQVATEVEKRLKSMASRVKVDGFRPGKVPLSIVRQQYGNQVRMEVAGEIMQSSFYEAVQQESLKPAGMPSLEPKLIEPGKGLEFDAVFEVMPEVTLADFDGVEIEKPVTEVADSDIDDTIENIRKQRMDYEDVDRACANEDRVNIDFTGEIDGEEFDGGKSEGFPLDLGAGRMIKGFEEGIIGHSAGDEFALDLAFPEDYHANELAGKDVTFTIKINSVQAPKLPEVDDEFAKSMGIEGGVEALRAEIKKNMDREVSNNVETRVKQQVMDSLLELNDIEAPAAMVENESKNLAQQMAQNLQSQGMDPSMMNITGEMYQEQAERRVKLGLLLSEVVIQKEIKAEEADIRSFVEEMASTYEKPQEVIDWYYADKNRLSEAESLVIERKIVDWALSQAKVTDKQMSVSELMGPAQQQ
ncbi:MAG: trigger factor [Gammaproteobacteria bacterium]|nr:trigger factor [Gammaproteobacteria bacterium]